MKGIIADFECPACGNLVEKKDVLKTNGTKSKYSFDAPKACSCGRKGGLDLVGFKSASVQIVADDVVVEE